MAAILSRSQCVKDGNIVDVDGDEYDAFHEYGVATITAAADVVVAAVGATDDNGDGDDDDEGHDYDGNDYFHYYNYHYFLLANRMHMHHPL